MGIGRWIGRCAMLLALCSLSARLAAAEVAYDAARFAAALARPEGFVVALVTDWCSTCSKQNLVIAELIAEPRFKDLTVFIADFDREAALNRRLRVVRQSTIVVFKGGKEVARSTGQSDKAALAALFAKAL